MTDHREFWKRVWDCDADQLVGLQLFVEALLALRFTASFNGAAKDPSLMLYRPADSGHSFLGIRSSGAALWPSGFLHRDATDEEITSAIDQWLSDVHRIYSDFPRHGTSQVKRSEHVELRLVYRQLPAILEASKALLSQE